jgi:hypothetical protein
MSLDPHRLELTEYACRIPGCGGAIAIQHGWKLPENPRIGGGPQGSPIIVSRFCQECGVEYRFAKPKEPK